jgi:hypothetical protein
VGAISLPTGKNIRVFFKFSPPRARFRRCLRRFALQFHRVAADSLTRGVSDFFRPIGELIHLNREIAAIGIIVLCPFQVSAAAGF